MLINRLKDEFNTDSKKKKAGIVALGAVTAPVLAAEFLADKMKGITTRPLYLEDFTTENLPDLIMIEDDAKYADDKFFEGAIGKNSKVKKTQIYSLWDCAVRDSHLTFLPFPANNTVYLVDPLDMSRYLKLEDYFEIIQDQKIAELKEIAYCLGSKRYTIEVHAFVEDKFEKRVKTNNEAKVKIVDGKTETSSESLAHKKTVCTFSTSGTYSVGRKAVAPTLRWFKNTSSVLSLVNEVLACDGKADTQDLSIESNKTSLMSVASAAEIDTTVCKIFGGNIGYSVKTNIAKQQVSRITLHLEF